MAVIPPNLEKYKDAKIFKDDEMFKPGMVKGPVTVGDNPDLLSKEEVAILTRGPKFTIRRVMDREKFLVEMEKAFIKVRWELRDNEDWLVEPHEEKTEEEKTTEEEGEVQEAKTRMVYDEDTNQINFQNLRATDAKHNVSVILPGPLSNKLEGELEMRRIQWASIYDTYLASFCDEEGVQESNLTREEQIGLKSPIKALDLQ